MAQSVCSSSRSDNSLLLACFTPLLEGLLPASSHLEFDNESRTLILVSTQTPHILALQQFTKNEWTLLLLLLESYPYYVPNEVLLANLTLLSPADCRKRLHEAETRDPKAVKRELKPVHRALHGIRAKLHKICPQLRIALIREAGYVLSLSTIT